MRTATRTALAMGVAAHLVLCTPAQAQDVAQMCKKARDVQVGQWAEYQLTGSQQDESVRMRIAIVGKKEVAGRPAWWIELTMNGDAGKVVTQVLAGGYPYQSAQIHEMIVKAGDQPAMKMPGAAAAMMRERIGATPSLGAADKCEQARVVGWEKVQVPAGEFRAVHLQPVDLKGDAWALETIPFGLIRTRGKDGEIVLLGYGRDAKSSITETPMTIPGMGGF
jgi:hypothetical protein